MEKKSTESKAVINANELRIGNIGRLWHFWSSQWTKPLQLEGKHIMWLSENKTSFNPIELTPGILDNSDFRKANFLERIFDGNFKKGNIIIGVDNGNKWWVAHKRIRVKENIQYLHKLQNIIYELTDEELTVNLQ